MIHSARPTVSSVANIVVAWNLFCFARFWKVGTDGRHVRKQWSPPAVTVGRPSGSKDGDWVSVTERIKRLKQENDWEVKVNRSYFHYCLSS